MLNTLNGAIEKLNLNFGQDFFKLLDKILVISSNIIKEQPLKDMLDVSKSGIIIIANSLILFYACHYIFLRIVSMYNGGTKENIGHFILKLIVIILLVNNSYYLCEEILNMSELFNKTISEFSKDIISNDASFENLQKEVTNLEEIVKTDGFTIESIIKSVTNFSSISLMIVFSIRYVTIIFLIIISPLTVMCLFSNITRGISKTWGKMLFINLIIEIFVRLIIMIPLAYKSNDTIYRIILLGSIYLLLRINNFVKEIISQVVLQRKA